MKVLAFTTRDYYSIVDYNYWTKQDCNRLTEFVSSLHSGKAADTKGGDMIKAFFIKENGSGIGRKVRAFWNNNSRLYMLKRIVDDDCILYVIPCVPEVCLAEGGECSSLELRQNYVGTFLQCVFDDLANNINSNDVFLAAHDLDIFGKNSERNMTMSDLTKESVLAEIIVNQKIIIDNIYGFQHKNEHGYLYLDFSDQLGCDVISRDTFNSVTNRIIESARKGKKVVLLDDTPQKIIDNFTFKEDNLPTKRQFVTAKPTEPVLFKYSIDEERHFSCYVPDIYKEPNDNEYLSLVNKINELLSGIKIESKPGEYLVHLLIHHKEEIELYEKDTSKYVYVYGQNYFNKSQSFYPIIHVCDADITFLTEKYRYSAIVDNSIWNYFVQINNESSQKQLSDAVQSIANNTSGHLYDLVVARELAELNARLTCDSYIIRFDKFKGHGDYVSPFVFHSEQNAKQMIEREFCQNKKNENKKIDLIKNYYWRFLLVDDKAKTPMSSFFDSDEELDGLPYNCKLTIIKRNLQRYFDVGVRSNDDDGQSGHNIIIEYVESIEEAMEKISVSKNNEKENKCEGKQYDIILLDYLIDQNNKRQYGYELLKKIQQDQMENAENENDLKYAVAPHRHKRLYCMFISAYTSAVHDRLLAEGLHLSEPYWFINSGACPTNTPQLFLYNLLKLMDKRIEDSGIPKLTPQGIYNLMESIFITENVRKAASEKYHEVLSLQYHYRGVLSCVKDYDKDNPFDTTGSVLMSDFVFQNGNLGGLLEHMGQMIHLVAYGTIRQWPEMWEEYVYFRSQFEEQCKKVESNIPGLKNREALYKAIEKYILELKRADR